MYRDMIALTNNCIGLHWTASDYSKVLLHRTNNFIKYGTPKRQGYTPKWRNRRPLIGSPGVQEIYFFSIFKVIG